LSNSNADCSIICGDEYFQVHKAVLTAASPYLERRLFGSQTEEEQVEIQNVDPKAMETILDFMYHGYYNPKLSLEGVTAVPSTGYCNHSRAAVLLGPPMSACVLKLECPCAGKRIAADHLLHHVQVYRAGDYFEMADLKQSALQEFLGVLHLHWDNEDLGWINAMEAVFTNFLDEDDDCELERALYDTLMEHPGLWVDDGDIR
ncbi:hypothetical protein EK21DRAFT_18394, partial [Setomelanomma holmii]